jgi:hypothetical protein
MTTVTIDQLAAAGVELSVPGLGAGWLKLPAADAAAFLADPTGWYARAYRVTRQRIEDYQTFVAERYQCRAATRRGTRCTRQVADGDRVEPTDFDPEVDVFCPQHLDQD